MMAYGNDFVLAIIQGGSPIREVGGKVHIPFRSEYKIRLKNKHNTLRTQARVWIDGRKVSNLGDFIIQPGQTLDLERFLDESMDTGNKFQFVPLSDNRVNDPTDGENGVIKVEFYREQKVEIRLDPVQIQPTFPKGPWNWDFNYRVDTFSYNNMDSNSSVISSSNVRPCSYTNRKSLSSPGATVEGSFSNQKFSVGEYFLTDPEPVILTLQLRGIQDTNYKTPEVFESAERSDKERFCGGCGKRRHKMSDKFCPRCGNKYNTIR